MSQQDPYDRHSSILQGFGYDVAIGVVAAAVNAAIPTYLLDYQKQSYQRVVLNQSGSQKTVSFKDFAGMTGGLSPFSISDGAASNDSAVQKCQSLGMALAYEIQIGVPDYLNSFNWFSLDGASQKVKLTLTFATFTLCGFDAGASCWRKLSQTTTPWSMSNTVGVRLLQNTSLQSPALETVLSTDKVASNHAELAQFQQAIIDASQTRVQQPVPLSPQSLVADVFINPVLTIDYGKASHTFTSQANELLTDAMIKMGNSTPFVLGTMGGPLNVSRSQCLVSSYVGPPIASPVPHPTSDQSDCDSLNFVTMLPYALPPPGGEAWDVLPPPRQLTWNWVTPQEYSSQESFDGIACLSRKWLSDRILTSMLTIIQENSVQMNLTWPFGPPGIVNGQGYYLGFSTKASQLIPTMRSPFYGSTMLALNSYGSSSYYNQQSGCDPCRVSVTTIYELTVSTSPSTLVVEHLYGVHVTYQGYTIYPFQFNQSGDVWPIRKRRTDTWSVEVNADGGITWKCNPVVRDEDTPSPYALQANFNHWQGFLHNAAQPAHNLKSPDMNEIFKLADLQQSFQPFPGGKSFNFTGVGFSDNGDLIAKITYRDNS